MKKNIVELNVVKAVAILAVLLIHVSADPRIHVPWGSASAPFYMVANQLSMFAVPVFIMINGLVLFYRYHDDWNFPQAIQFYKKRLKFIVIPYLVWSAIPKKTRYPLILLDFVVTIFNVSKQCLFFNNKVV